MPIVPHTVCDCTDTQALYAELPWLHEVRSRKCHREKLDTRRYELLEMRIAMG